MKTRVKGNRIQRKCINLLEKEGYIVGKVEVGGKFVKEKDLFGLFDLVALKTGIVRFVQVTTSAPHPHYKYQEFVNVYGTDQIWIDQFVWENYKGFVWYKYYPGRKHEVRKWLKQ